VAGGLPRDYQVTVDKSGKRVRVDGKDPRGLPNYFAGIKAVAFVPSDLRMVDGGPELRRSFLDRAAFTLDPTYLGLARDYASALKQKNALLRQAKRTGRPPDRALMDVWNERLITAGVQVVGRRVGFLKAFAPVFREVHEGITGAAKGRAEIRYRGPVSADAVAGGQEGIEAELRRKVQGAFPQEVRRGHSTVGPHRDDWELRVGGEPLRSFGSQGQVRSAALAMRMAVMVLTKEAAGVCPLFLLDDVSSELDASRNKQLMERLTELEAQVLVTTTSLDNLKLDLSGYTAFRVAEGEVSITV
jgi:DNA replication and repair protein RecF